MAYAVMGGLVVATLLTLVFLPALYVACYRITPFKETTPFAKESLGASTDDPYAIQVAAE